MASKGSKGKSGEEGEDALLSAHGRVRADLIQCAVCSGGGECLEGV